MNTDRLVGIPYRKGGNTFDGADCWGLTQLALSTLYNISINICSGATFAGKELAEAIENNLSNPHFTRKFIAMDGCVAIFYSKKTGRPEHSGLCIGDGYLLHSLGSKRHGSSTITLIENLRPLFTKVEFYKYCG